MAPVAEDPDQDIAGVPGRSHSDQPPLMMTRTAFLRPPNQHHVEDGTGRQNNTGPWTMITDALGVPEMADTYTASDSAANNDVGLYLRAVAEYTDNRGGQQGPRKTLVSPYTVKGRPKWRTTRSPSSPRRPLRGTWRRKARRTANVGAPVTATDDDNHVLNYSHS